MGEGPRNRQLFQHLGKGSHSLCWKENKKNFQYIKEQNVKQGTVQVEEENMIDSLWWGLENGFLAIIQNQDVIKK